MQLDFFSIPTSKIVCGIPCISVSKVIAFLQVASNVCVCVCVCVCKRKREKERERDRERGMIFKRKREGRGIKKENRKRDIEERYKGMER